MAVDNLRHLKLFDARQFNKSVHIIGAGATGSYLALQLAKLGVLDLHVWDFDKIEEHNLANQLYGPEHIGMPKVEALSAVIKMQADIEIKAHNEKVVDQRLSGHIFLLTDTMSSRQEIFKNCIRFKPHVEAMYETRMGVTISEIRTISPVDPVEVEGWEGDWFPDEEEIVNPSDCGARTTIGATASSLANHATWQFLKKVAGKPVENMVWWSCEPFMMETKNYKKAG